VELVRSLGAEEVIDYQKEDLSKIDQQFDVVFDTVGKYPKVKVNRLLAQEGRYISTHTSPVREKREYLELLRGIAEEGNIKPVIDRKYVLSQIREAHAYVESGRKTGNVVINMDTSMKME
jgi:NADPH:quinone reductase-like Zn-dependent oxidoreductase